MQRSEYTSKQNNKTNKTTSKMYCTGILAVYITRSVQDLRLPPRGRTGCWLTAGFFIDFVAANKLTWTLSVVSPSVEGQFSISYMKRQAAVQLFINASILSGVSGSGQTAVYPKMMWICDDYQPK